MIAESSSVLARLLHECQLDWLVGSYADTPAALAALSATLEAVEEESRVRFGNDGTQLSEHFLAKEYERNPHKVAAFLQALGATGSPPMLLMAWRIIQGAEIRSLRMTYQSGSGFHLAVTLISPRNGTPEEYKTDDISDASLLRHFGIMKIDGQPVFEGFYPLHLLE
ncbi:MAG: hypothetical protein HYU36_01585 [Planctomycetes bacterium]|nr:hypothetical protein [Planctomycetota bacterium]